jgi:hypothetical protein
MKVYISKMKVDPKSRYFKILLAKRVMPVFFLAACAIYHSRPVICRGLHHCDGGAVLYDSFGACDPSDKSCPWNKRPTLDLLHQSSIHDPPHASNDPDRSQVYNHHPLFPLAPGSVSKRMGEI